MHGFLRFERAREAWGELLEKTDLYPARWRTKGFPSAEQIAEAGMVEKPG